MKDGIVLSEAKVEEVLKAKGLSFVSRSAVAEAKPAVVYVLNVAGCG